MLAISVSMSCLFAYLSLTGGVYKQWWLNLIETAFILNLLISSIATFYQTNAAAISVKPITYTSVGTAFALFVAIILYHIMAKVLSTKQGQKINVRMIQYRHLLKLHRKSKQSVQSEGVGTDLAGHDSESKDKVTHSVIQLLEEPLI